jgi:hypothetical protein
LTVSPTDIPTEYYPSVFHRELQNNYGILPFLPMDIPTKWHSSVFDRELPKNYGILPLSPMDIPMEWHPWVFDRELQKNYSPCHNNRWIYRHTNWQLEQFQKHTHVRAAGQSAHLPIDSSTAAANPRR